MLSISRMHGASSTQPSTILQLYKVANSFGVLFNGLLAELPTILDGFSTNTTSDYIGVRGQSGAVGSHEVAGQNTRQVMAPLYGHIGSVESPILW